MRNSKNKDYRCVQTFDWWYGSLKSLLVCSFANFAQYFKPNEIYPRHKRTKKKKSLKCDSCYELWSSGNNVQCNIQHLSTTYIQTISDKVFKLFSTLTNFKILENFTSWSKHAINDIMMTTDTVYWFRMLKTQFVKLNRRQQLVKLTS